jgi:hypothetical protein
MSRGMKRVFYAFYLVLLLPVFVFPFSSCAPTIQVVQPIPNVKLRQYTRIFLYPPRLVGRGDVLEGPEAGVSHAFNSLKFELASAGFRVVDNLKDAELVGEFAIDDLYYDPWLAEWTAKHVILVLKDNMGNTLFIFRAKANWAKTNSIDSLISKIVEAIRQRY